MDVSIMTALRMVRRGIIKGRQLCRGAPWVIKVEDMAAYREQKPSRRSLTSDPSQQSFMFQWHRRYALWRVAAWAHNGGTRHHLGRPDLAGKHCHGVEHPSPP